MTVAPQHPKLGRVDGLIVVKNDVDEPALLLTPDEAVTLGYALFEQGLILKGRMKPPTKGEL